jgi:hypothetical protein
MLSDINNIDNQEANKPKESDKNVQSNMPHEKIIELVFYIKQITYNTILGTESAMYKKLKEHVKSPMMNSFVIQNICKYHNYAYKSLILDSDKYIFDEFGRMNEISGHSYICLLNITLNLCLLVEEKLDRNLLDDSTYDNYMNVVRNYVKEILKVMNLEKFISHKCTGIDIKSCNPDEDFVVIKQ